MAKKSEKQERGKTEAEREVEKQANFVRLIKPRMDKLESACKSVRQLASPNYVRTDAQGRAVVLAAKAYIQGVVDAFEGKGTSGGGFALPE